jgi:hypothetical protein|tara:strand:- start:876 stop:1022 length:147 start_codon:yes stop_codon:yes gene_type:complete
MNKTQPKEILLVYPGKIVGLLFKYLFIIGIYWLLFKYLQVFGNFCNPT